MTSIPIKDTLPYIQYIVSGSPQTSFTYPFPILREDALLVFQRAATDIPDDLTQQLTLTTDYTVTGVGQEDGGTVELVVAAPVNDIVTITRQEDIERLVQYLTGGLFKAADFNFDLNQAILYIQQNNLLFRDRSVAYQFSDIVASKDITLPVLAAKESWRMSETATEIEGVVYEEGSGYSTLRSDLERRTSGNDGARRVGYYTPSAAESTVKDYFDDVTTLVNTNTEEIEQLISQLHNTGTTAGGPDTYTITLASGITAYVEGLTIIVKMNVTNNASATINVNVLGAISLARSDGSTINANDLEAGRWYSLIYTQVGPDFRLNAAQNASEISPGELRFSTAAEVKAATLTTTAISPSRFLNHPASPKAWALIDSDGTIIDGYNVASASYIGTGEFQVNLAITMSTGNYCILGTSLHGGGYFQYTATNPTSFKTQNSTSDAVSFSVAIWGTLA